MIKRQFDNKRGKGLIRSLNRRGTRSDMSPAVAKKKPYKDPSVCDVCGSVYANKTWRRDRPLPVKLIDAAAWTVCPECEQTKSGEYFGRVIARAPNAADLDAIRARIANRREDAGERRKNA